MECAKIKRNWYKTKKGKSTNSPPLQTNGWTEHKMDPNKAIYCQDGTWHCIHILDVLVKKKHGRVA
jgi:hypothetical protein